MTPQERREWAYWLTLAFRLEREPRRAINGLVLTADRKAQLRLLDLVRMSPEQRPPEIAKYASTLDRLLEAEGKVSAQAFVIDQVLSVGGRIVPISAAAYPSHLVHRIGPDRAPTVLTVVGSEALWKTPGVAISGSRKAGPTGLAFAKAAGRAVAAAGEVVVCGLAGGVDREALDGALEAGGRVIGIAPEGIMHSRWLRRRELAEGRLAIVSEFAPDDRWSAARAMTRNRTIAGFSSALVIADCVASGGTTDQLEVHRAAGLKVYVRRGFGQGALVDELCRRPGVTPWDWNNGPVTWPPQPVRDPNRVECAVTFSEERVQIQVDAPRQLSLDAILDEVRARYDASERPQPYATAADTIILREALVTSGYSSTPPDLVLAELERVSTQGATAREIEQATRLSSHRVRKRLKELMDARLVVKSGRRFVKSAQDAAAASAVTTKPEPHSKHTANGTMPSLFSEQDLQASRATGLPGSGSRR